LDIVSYESKWEISDADFRKKIEWACPAKIGKKLEKELIQLSTEAYRVMGLRGYGRVDIRMDGDKPMILEINPNPDLNTDCFTVASALAAGMTYRDLIRRIVEYALE
jgi:D-alanine-D-alanine ligase